MADNFNLRAFLSENSLTKSAKLLKEGSDYGFDALMDAADDLYPEGTPENGKLVFAIEKALHANQIDTSEFGDDLGAAARAVEAIANEIGLGDEPDRDMGYDERDDRMEEGAETMTKADLLAKGEYTTSKGVTYEILESDPWGGGWAGKHAPTDNSVWVQKKGTKASDMHRGHYVNYKLIVQELEKAKKAVNEISKLTARERRLVEMVQNALGVVPQVAEDEMVKETPLPKYESIEELMKEIEHGTNEAAHKYKMEEMKRVYEALETKVTSLEEGENAEHIDQKKVKQMRKDIAALRKAEEKLRKEFDKKFAGKEKKEAPKKEKEDVTLAEGNFNLRKFLAENRK